jgi:hypothetical protein
LLLLLLPSLAALPARYELQKVRMVRLKERCNVAQPLLCCQIQELSCCSCLRCCSNSSSIALLLLLFWLGLRWRILLLLQLLLLLDILWHSLQWLCSATAGM